MGQIISTGLIVRNHAQSKTDEWKIRFVHLEKQRQHTEQHTDESVCNRSITECDVQWKMCRGSLMIRR